VLALAAIGTMCAASASAASWETVQDFGPLKLVEPNPPTWPEDVQLGGASGMAVNVNGTGGVAPGTIYTIGTSGDAAWHAARYSPTGEFELAWTSTYHCGPKAALPSTCPTYPTGGGGGVDIALDQTTGNVYVFSKYDNPTVYEYNSDGTGPITRFLELDSSETIAASPAKLHDSPLNENIAVDGSGLVYVVDEESANSGSFKHRLTVFEPQTPGEYEHYVYAGQGRDIAAGPLGTHSPFRPAVDDMGHVYVAGEKFIDEYNVSQPGAAICTISIPKGGLVSMTVNPATGAPFYYSAGERLVHQLTPCNDEGKFEEAGPPFAPLPQRGNLEAMAFDPSRAYAEELPPAGSGQFGESHPVGVLLAAAGESCPGIGSCPEAARSRGSLGYMFAIQISHLPVVQAESATRVGTDSATLNAEVNPKGSQTNYRFQYLADAAYAENTHFQRVDVAASGGNFKLGFAGESSSALPFDATPAEVTSALEGLSSVGQGTVTVEGGPGDPAGSSAYEIIFGPGLGAGPLPAITADGAELLGVDSSARVEDTFFAGASQAPSIPVALGTGQVPLLASVTVSGLLPATTYRFRVLAGSAEGTATGSSESFQTLAPAMEALPDGRAYELVSPNQKNGGEVLPAEPDVASCGSECKPGLAAHRFPVQVSPSGDGIAYQGQPFLLNEGASEFDEYISTRGAAGWTTTSLSPPLAGDAGSGGFEAFGLDSSLSTAIVFAQNQSLTEEAPLGFPNLFEEPSSNRFDLRPILKSPPANRSAGFPGHFEMIYVGATPDHSRIFFEANDALTANSPVAPAAVDGGAGKLNLYEWAGGQLRLVNVQPGNNESIPGATLGSGYQLSQTQPRVTDFAHAISADGTKVFWSAANGQVYVREDAERTLEIPDHAGKFLSASANGRKVLLSDGHLYDLETGVDTDLTGGQGGFEGIAGQSEDLGTIYLVDTAVLTATPNNRGASPESGEYNLYAWSAGAPSFVTTLARGANGPGDEGTGLATFVAAPVARAAEASPDGRWLAFNSFASATGANTRGACSFDPALQKYVGSVPCQEVYLYDSQTGSLACPSCNPAGSPPLGGSFLRRMYLGAGYLEQPRYLTDDGRLFFDSRDSLSLLDTNNGVEDTYQYEPNGIGSCAKSDGCTSLISSGRGPDDANFLAADSSGENVFFTTRQQLVPRDRDALIDIYDARVGGGLAVDYATPPAECVGEGCQASVAAMPSEPTPGSSTGVGTENATAKQKPCLKRKVRRRGKCVKKHQKTKAKSGNHRKKTKQKKPDKRKTAKSYHGVSKHGEKSKPGRGGAK
jgi:hypothetical protein